MIKKTYKGRCERRTFKKSNAVCRLYNKIQVAYADQLEANAEIIEFRCNVPLEGEEAEEYTTDFLCKKADGTYRVRECVWRKQLLWPSVVKLLDISRAYWSKRGVEDWGIVIDKEESGGSK